MKALSFGVVSLSSFAEIHRKFVPWFVSWMPRCSPSDCGQCLLKETIKINGKGRQPCHMVAYPPPSYCGLCTARSVKKQSLRNTYELPQLSCFVWPSQPKENSQRACPTSLGYWPSCVLLQTMAYGGDCYSSKLIFLNSLGASLVLYQLSCSFAPLLTKKQPK